MKRLVFILLLLTFFVLPSSVDASIFCSFDTKVYLKSLSSNINVSYDYVEQNGNAVFQITFSNVPKNYILKDKKSGQTYRTDGSKELGEIIVSNYGSGQSYLFDIYASVVDCDDEILSTVYVTLPYYNSYYKESVCKGLEEYELCTKWSNHGLSREKFIETVNAYKESLNKKDEEDGKENGKDKKIPYLLEFYLNYYYIILPVIIAGAGYIIYRQNKKDSFF